MASVSYSSNTYNSSSKESETKGWHAFLLIQEDSRHDRHTDGTVALTQNTLVFCDPSRHRVLIRLSSPIQSVKESIA